MTDSVSTLPGRLTRLLGYRPVQLLLVLGFAAAFVVLPRLRLPLLEPEEALYAELPREMLADGWVMTPTLHGEPYLDKPPLLYWSVMLSMRVFGVHVWSARLVATIAAWLTVVVVFLWGRACGGWRVGLVAAAVLTLTGDFVYRGPMLTPNGLLGLFTTGGLALGHYALKAERVRFGWWISSAVATAFGVLTKGPVAIVLVAGPLFSLPWVLRGVKRPNLLHWGVYLGVLLAVSAPWFVAVAVRQPEFIEYFFWKHHVERYTDPFDHAKPIYFYLPQVLLAGLPWTLLPIGLLVRRSGPWRVSAEASFALLSALAVLAFFSLSGSKRSVYLVPLWPVFAVGIGSLLVPVLTAAKGTTGWRMGRGWILAGGLTSCVLAIGTVFWLPGYHRKFGLDRIDVDVAERPSGVPVYCYPHPWNSLDFALSAECPAFTDADQPRLMERLREVGEAMVLVKAGHSCDAFVASMPNDLNVTERRPAGVATLLTVRRR